MDKFDELLMKKAKNEKEEFKLPESFDNKIDDIFRGLNENDKKKKWYTNKKMISIAAGLVFIILGFSIKEINNGDKGFSASNSCTEMADTTKSMSEADTAGNINEQSSMMNDSLENIVDGWNVKSIVINDINEINDADRIKDILECINNVHLIYDDEYKFVEENSQYRLIFNGEEKHYIYICSNFLKVDDVVYKCNNDDELNKLTEMLQ